LAKRKTTTSLSPSVYDPMREANGLWAGAGRGMARALTQRTPTKRTPATTVAMPAVSTTVDTTSAEVPTSAALSAYPNRGGPAVPQDLFNISPAQ